MKVFIAALLLLSNEFSLAAMILKQPSAKIQQLSEDCTIIALADTCIDNIDHGVSFECVLDAVDTNGISNLVLPMKLSADQNEHMKILLNRGISSAANWLVYIYMFFTFRNF